jgi:hypothetical protein
MQKLKRIFIFMSFIMVSLQSFSALTLNAFAYTVGDVVINEIAWAGSLDNSSDEWIELYNTTNQTIDLTGWYIEDDVSSSYTIVSGSVSPHGYFLIEDAETSVSNVVANSVIGLSFANAGDSLVFKNSTGVVIDTVNGSGGAWYSGDPLTKATMERIDPNVTLDTAGNWASALNSNGSVSSLGSAILGTPGSANSNFGGSGLEVSLTPSKTTLNTGEQLTVSVEVDGATDLYSYGFDINYDPAVLSYDSSSESNFLKIDAVTTAYNASLENSEEGTLIVGNARLINPPSGVDGSGELFNIVFDVIGANGSSTSLTFGAGSFLSDSLGGVPAVYNPTEITVGTTSVSTVSNLQIGTGTERYSLSLSWTGGLGSDSYIVKKKMTDGAFVTIGNNLTSLNFVDSASLVPGITYFYQVIAVSGGVQSLPIEINGADNRGIAGDIDRSDRVDGKDIESLARSYGSAFGDEEYLLQNDTNYDGIIDGSDLIDIGSNFGLTYS